MECLRLHVPCRFWKVLLEDFVPACLNHLVFLGLSLIYFWNWLKNFVVAVLSVLTRSEVYVC